MKTLQGPLSFPEFMERIDNKYGVLTTTNKVVLSGEFTATIIENMKEEPKYVNKTEIQNLNTNTTNRYQEMIGDVYSAGTETFNNIMAKYDKYFKLV